MIAILVSWVRGRWRGEQRNVSWFGRVGEVEVGVVGEGEDVGPGNWQ